MAKHKHNQPGLPFVIIDNDGYLNLYTHDGHLVIANETITLKDSIGGPNYVEAIFRCNIVGSKEEMKEVIEEYKERTPYYVNLPES